MGGGCIAALAAAFDGVTEAEDEGSPHGPGGEVPENSGVHGGIDAGVCTAAEDGSGVLGAPPADGHEADGDVDGSEDGQNGGEDFCLAGGGEAAEQDVADVEEPEEEVGGEACVPCPPDAPCGAAPEHAGGEAYAGVDDCDLRGGEGEGVGGECAFWIAMTPVEEGEGREAVEIREDEAEDGVGEVVEEDAVEVAHGGFGGRGAGLIEADGQHEKREEEPEQTGGLEFARVCHWVQVYRVWRWGIGANRPAGWSQRAGCRRW